MAPKGTLNVGSLSQQLAASRKGAVGKMKSKKKHAGRFTGEDALKIARAVLYLGPRYINIRGKKRSNTELPLGSAVMFSRLKVLLGFQHHSESIMHYFKRWRLENVPKWEAMKEEAEASGDTYFNELAQLEEGLIQRGELEDDDLLEIEDGGEGSKGDERSVGASDHETEGRQQWAELLSGRKRSNGHKKNAGRLTAEDMLDVAKAVIYLGPRYASIRGKKCNIPELPVGSKRLFGRMKTLLNYQQHSDSIKRCFKKWREENMAEWEAMKEEAEANGETYFDELAQLEQDLIERGEFDDHRMEIEDGDDHSVEASDHEGREQSEEPPSTRPRKPQRNKNAGRLTAQDMLNIARAVIYLGPRYTRRQGRKHDNTELPFGSRAMFGRMKTLLNYQQHPESVRGCFKKWRKENMAEWEAVKAEAEANGEGYFDDWAQLEEDLIERGELDDNRIRMEDGEDVSKGDDFSVGRSDQQVEDREPSEQSFPPQDEAETGDGQTAHIHFHTAQPDAQQEDGEDGEHYVVEQANSQEDDVREEEGHNRPGAQKVHNHYHFHGPVIVLPGWIPPQ